MYTIMMMLMMVAEADGHLLGLVKVWLSADFVYVVQKSHGHSLHTVMPRSRHWTQMT